MEKEQEEIIKQLRNMRVYEREMLYNQLYPKYQEGLVLLLKDINEEYEEAKKQKDVDDCKYSNTHIFGVDTLRNNYYESLAKLSRIDTKRQSIIKSYDASAELTTKLKEFDIETERMILAHMCHVELICGNKRALPMLEK